MSGRLTSLALAALIGMLVAACGGNERPDAASWLSIWNAIVGQVPDQAELGDPPDASLCQSTLAALREQSDGLLPSPSITVDDLVSDWEAVAESAFFDCPPSGEEIGSFDDAYSEMRRIEESVETALTED